MSVACRSRHTETAFFLDHFSSLRCFASCRKRILGDGSLKPILVKLDISDREKMKFYLMKGQQNKIKLLPFFVLFFFLNGILTLL